MSEGFSDQDVVTAATALWREVYGDIEPKLDSGASAWSCVSDARAVLTALSAAGRLLPEGCQASERFRVVFMDADGEGTWGCTSLERARTLAEKVPAWAEKGEIRRQDTYTTPWSVVEPVAIQARAEEKDHG